jgi:peptidoglycan/xylan/chitin deacetylase (PgdA/CDA1 family)
MLAEPFARVRAMGSKQPEMTVALTFDDGPDPVWTPRLLTLLARLGARATFFPIAPRAAAQPELIARMLSEGHVIGLHCDEHVRHSTRDIEWGRRDTARALERLSKLGVTPSLWRTPWGDTAPWSDVVAAEFGLRIVGWTVDTHDWRGDTATEMFTASHGSLCSCAIVLAHDGIGPGARRADAEQTLEFVTLAARHAVRRGLKLEALA